MSDLRDADEYVKEIITHEEALKILGRFCNSHFDNPEEHARASIPADPHRDDDLRLAAYIKQQRMKDAFLKPRAEENSGAETMDTAARMTQSVAVASESVAGRAPVAQMTVTTGKDIAEWARDAARYRWLRDEQRLYGGDSELAVTSAGGSGLYTGNRLDAAIDAAIAAERGDVEQERKP